MIISSEKESDRYLEVNSCAKQFLSDRDYTMLRKDGRKDYHILYITNGFCMVEFDNREFKVGAGNIILFKPYEKQKYRFLAKDNSISSYIHFSGTACAELLERFGLSHKHIYYVGTSNKLEQIFSKMEDEFILKKCLYEDICSGLLLQFLATAGRLSEFIEKEINLNIEKNMDSICKYIHNNYWENNSIQYFADMCHLSVSRFSHAFKESTGLSPKNYIILTKINIAIGLIESTNLSMADIATAIGIEDVNYFSRLFKKHTGHTPTFYRS